MGDGMGDLHVVSLGLVEYRRALEIQHELRDARQADAIPDTLLLLEHPPVYTRGRRTAEGELPMGEAWYLTQGIEIVDVDRGGKVTYHGPGQMVGYPIMRVSDVVGLVRSMEQAIIAALAEEGVEARSRTCEGPAFTGVWVEDRKIASIGVHVAKGVTTHGFAVNVENDMQPWNWIVPCGLPEAPMTSLYKETGRPGGLAALKPRVVRAFAAEKGHDAVDVDPATALGHPTRV
jgi:lipoyl(octanoyl) transferase